MLSILKSVDNFFCQIEGKTQHKTLSGASQTLNGLNEVNEQFNRELELLASEKIASNHVFKLGYPNNMYLKAGVENLPIELSARTMQNKASKNYKRPHPFEPSSLINLPLALHEPIAIFKGSQNRVVVLLELEDNGNNFTAILGIYQPPKGRRKGEKVNSIISIFPKDDATEVANILKLPVLWEDKTKMSRFNQVHNSCYAEGLNTAHKATNVKQKNTNVKSLPQKKQTLGSILYNLFVSKEYKDQGLDGWREDKEKFKIELVNDIKTFLFTKWEKPWVPGLIFDDKNNVISGFRNISGRTYNNQSNVISLAQNCGQSPYFITLSKLQQLGGKILDKKKVVSVISYIPIFKDKAKLDGVTEEGKPDFMLPKFHDVINVDFADGIKKPTYKTVEFEELELNEYVENFLNELKKRKRIPTLHHDEADRCYYVSNPPNYTKDEIHLVEIKQFKEINEYYSTLFHEITHSTKNPKRLGRGKDNKKLDYANEELVAEMGAMIICEELGLEYKRQNSLSYLNGWLKQAKGTDIDSALIEAYAYACDAADYLLDGIELDKLVPKTLVKRAKKQEGVVSPKEPEIKSGGKSIPDKIKALEDKLKEVEPYQDVPVSVYNTWKKELEELKNKKEKPLIAARKEAMKLIGSKGIQELKGKWKIDWNNETSIREAIQTLIEAEAEAKNILSTLSGVQTQILSVNNLYPNKVNLKDLKNKYNAFKNKVILNHDKKIDIVFKSIGANKSINGRKDKNGKVIPIDSIIATAISQLPYLLEYGTFRAFGKADKPVHRKVKGVRFWNFTSKLKIDGVMYSFVIPVLETENTSIFQYSIEYADVRKILANKKSAVGLKAKINQG